MKPTKETLIIPQKTSHFDGEKLKSALKSQNIRPASLARILKVSKTQVHRWLRGKSSPTVEQYLYIIQLLKIRSYTDLVNLDAIIRLYTRNKAELQRIYDEKVKKNKNYKEDAEEVEEKADEPLVPTKSSLFSYFPMINGITFPSQSVKNASLTEKSPDGFNCTFEEHVNRLYMRKLFMVEPDRYRKLDEIPRSSLIRESGGSDDWGDPTYVYIETEELYNWKSWDIINGIPLFVEESKRGNESVAKWLLKLKIDNAESWYREFYGIDDALKIWKRGTEGADLTINSGKGDTELLVPSVSDVNSVEDEFDIELSEDRGL